VNYVAEQCKDVVHKIYLPIYADKMKNKLWKLNSDPLFQKNAFLRQCPPED